MTSKPIDAYPLLWPVGWPRCQEPTYARFQTSIAAARDGLMRELDLLGVHDVVINSNAQRTKSGEIAYRQPRLTDTGVAVYFTLDGQQRCIPCDRWILLEDNIQAVRKTIEAIRGIERWGTAGIVAAAFQGFQALPEGDNAAWWRVLEVEPTASEVEIKAAYQRLVKRYHPDAGGSRELFERVQAAYEQAKGRRSA
jgi:hypothetical protein